MHVEHATEQDRALPGAKRSQVSRSRRVASTSRLVSVNDYENSRTGPMKSGTWAPAKGPKQIASRPEAKGGRMRTPVAVATQLLAIAIAAMTIVGLTGPAAQASSSAAISVASPSICSNVSPLDARAACIAIQIDNNQGNPRVDNAALAFVKSVPDQTVPGWNGAHIPYSWGGGKGELPGLSDGTCRGYTGPYQKTCKTFDTGRVKSPLKTYGLDCAGFTRWVYYLAYGHDIFGQDYNNVREKNAPGMHADKAAAPALGDFVFFTSKGALDPHHVGIYVGLNPKGVPMMVDEPFTARNVRGPNGSRILVAATLEEDPVSLPGGTSIKKGTKIEYYKYTPPATPAAGMSAQPTGHEALFSDYSYSSLWVTNGTASGTVKLKTFQPHSLTDIATLGDRALFAADGKLWITNGTSHGTKILSSAAEEPMDITVVGNKALFAALNSTGAEGLWVTDGSTVQELAVSGAFSRGITPTDITPFGDGALFSGADTHGTLTPSYGLWFTNETSKGTREIASFGQFASPQNITVVGGRAMFDLPGGAVDPELDLYTTDGVGVSQLIFNSTTSYPLSLVGAVPYLAPLGGDAVFASDSYEDGDLWFTDGTATGTMQLLNWGSVADLVPWNGKVLFSGGVYGASNNGLWVSNGTVGGTTEVANISGASWDWGLDPTNITPFGNKALFWGDDPPERSCDGSLWVTDGSAASPLTRPRENPESCFPPTFPPTGCEPTEGPCDTNIVVLGNEALFDGLDGGLWVTNGTPQGTSELKGIRGVPPPGSASASAFPLSPADMTVL